MDELPIVARPRPFVKWVGGKTQLLEQLCERIPRTFNPDRDLYVEPFLGGGALYWLLGPRRARLSDSCADLMCAWQVVGKPEVLQSLVDDLVNLTVRYQADPEGTYYLVRSEHPDGSWSSVRRAARMIFLNKTCFNGLYRVNGRGEFNAPWGKNPLASICQIDNLRACCQRLSEGGVELACQDFDACLRSLLERDDLEGALVYLDPPYVPRSSTSYFVRYQPGGFDYSGQLLLVRHAAELRERGAHVIASQAADPVLVEEYRRCGFRCEEVRAVRRINSRGDGRGEVPEYIISGKSRKKGG